MASDTEANGHGFKVEVVGEKCGLDMSSYEDLPSATVGGCAGGDCNGDGKEDYVFVNGSDVASDDHGQLDGNGELNASESNIESHEEVGEDSARVNEGDRLETLDGDAVVDVPGERHGDGDLNASELNVDSHERVNGGDSEVNGVDRLEIDNGESNEITNENNIDGGELKNENGVDVETESLGTIEVGELVQKIAEVNTQSEVTVEDGHLALENGGSNVLEGDVDIKVKNFDVEETKDTKPITNGFKGGEPCIQKGDGCDLSSDCTAALILDNDDKTRASLVVDKGSADTDEEQNVIALMVPTPLITDGDTERHHPAEPQRHEDQGNRPETLQTEAGMLQLVEDNIQLHVDEVPVREMEPVDSNVKETKSFETAFGNEILEDGIQKMEATDGNFKSPLVPASSEPNPLNGEAKESLMDDPVAVNQSLVRPQLEVQLTDEESAEKGPIEAEDMGKEHGNLVSPEGGARNEVLNFADSEAVKSEVTECKDGESRCKNATNLTAGSEEVQELHAVPAQFEEAENQSRLDSTALGMGKRLSNGSDHSCVNNVEISADIDKSQTDLLEDMCSGTSGKPALDCEMKVDGQAESDLTAVVVEGQRSSVEDVCHDQMAEETGSVNVMDTELSTRDVNLGKTAEETVSVNVMDKGCSSENLDLGKTTAVEEATSQPKAQAAKWADVDENVDEFDGIGSLENKVPDLVSDNVMVPMAHEICGDDKDCLRSEHGDLDSPVNKAADLPATPDSDMIKEQGVVDNASYVTDSIPNVETCNGSLPYSVPDADVQIRAENGEVDVVHKSNCISSNTSKPKISFGFFECEAPFSHSNVNVQPEVLKRSVEFTSSKSQVKPSEAVLNSEANGVLSAGYGQDKSSDENLPVERTSKDEVSSSPLQGSGIDAFDGQNLSADVVRKPFYYLIRVPRYDDEKLRERIRLGEIEVDEKTRRRDSVRAEYQKIKATVNEHKPHLHAAKLEERAARELVMAKKREIDSAQSLVNLAKKEITVDDVESRILNMEHRIQHETLNLNEEKQLVREIEQLKNLRNRLSKNKRSQDKLQQALDQRVEVEEHLKVLRKEMDALRDNFSKAEESVKIARKKYDEQTSLLNELYLQFTSADAVRQKAYEDLLTLRKQRTEKNKYFWNYKDDAKAANEYSMAGDKDNLEHHCVNQVEKVMELWNKNEEFRKEYIRCNTRSTLRRFRTLDGRSLGPNEEPPSVGNVSYGRVVSPAKVNSAATVPTTERGRPLEPKKAEENSAKKVPEQKNKIVQPKKMAEATSKNSSTEPLGRTEVEEKKEEATPTKEELELAKKTEQLRREEEAARLREQRRLDEKAKAKEALERKRRMAEKAQARAEFKARKEAEEKEKEKEKKAKKKEKKMGLSLDIAESEPAVLPESSSEAIREPPEVAEKPVMLAKKPSPYAKQIKTTKSLPPPMRNKGKKRIKQWMCILVPVLLALALFFLGDSDLLRNRNLSYDSAF